MKKFIALALSLCIVGGSAPAAVEYAVEYAVTASAATVVDSGTCGENVTWTLDDEGTLTISGEGDMYDYSYGDSPFVARNDIKSLIIEDSVTSVFSSAFLNCTNLESVKIGNSVKSIGVNAFAGCTSLTSVDIPNSVTSIGECAFEGCTKLEQVTLSESIRIIEWHTFASCESIKSITIPESVELIDREVFYECGSLESITILNPDCEIHENFAHGFNGTICGYSESTAQTIAETNGYTFKIFEVYDIVDSGTCGDNLTWILDSKGTLTISGTGDMTDYTHPFDSSFFSPFLNYRRLIKDVIIADGVTSIGDYAFNSCALTSIIIPDSVTSIGNYAFSYCESLTSITIPDSVISIGEYAFGNTAWLMDKQTENPLVIVNGILIDGSICEGNVIIPDSVTSIGDFAFDSCALTSIIIPDSVTSIGDGAFTDCKSLMSVTIPDSVTSIGNWAFQFCENFTSITIPASVTSIGNGAFNYYTSLTTINVDENNPNYKSIEGVLFDKNVTTIIYYPKEKNYTAYTIPDSVTNINDFAFYECDRLTSITIPDSVTSIGVSAFESCSSLTSITIPDSVESIGSWAFGDCPSLGSITILNPDCEIFKNNQYTISPNSTIYGYTNSTAQAYAKINGYTFVALDDGPSELTAGDINGDGDVTVADATYIMQWAAAPDEYPLSDTAKKNGDVTGGGDGITTSDALAIQQYLSGSLGSLTVGS